MILQVGIGLGPIEGAVNESLDPATAGEVVAALAQVVGDGGVVISADHTSVTVQPPSAAWAAAQQAATAQAALRSLHVEALAAIRPALVNSATAITNDLAALQTIVTALEAGTVPTAAQLPQLLRLLVRAMAVLNG